MSEGEEFQSTSPSGEEDDSIRARSPPTAQRFNPRPPRARRTTSQSCSGAGLLEFQSTSPSGEEDDPVDTQDIWFRVLFQSTSPSGEEDDSGRPTTRSWPGCFNPRPPRARRTTWRLIRSVGGCSRFNPRPPRARRTTRSSSRQRKRKRFQSTSPSGEEDDSRSLAPIPTKMFQSTSPSGEEDDHHALRGGLVEQVSIHVPLGRGGRRGLPASGVHDFVFQSTSPSGEEDDLFATDHPVFNKAFQSTSPSGEEDDVTPGRTLPKMVTFQSTSPSGEEDDHRGLRVRGAQGVSIHVPLGRGGRPVRRAGLYCSMQFQSTSPSGEEDDLATRGPARRARRFNPRPPRARRTTRRLSTVSMLIMSFNPRPPRARRTTLMFLNSGTYSEIPVNFANLALHDLRDLPLDCQAGTNVWIVKERGRREPPGVGASGGVRAATWRGAVTPPADRRG
ncbi:Hypothetical protein CAP_3259 [Chondromyces apiculatus DSM 436]|uniref:Uncharacterized protein n=1 Tax=Chondromyces apiculatus DSM 436 TaxID=1192034 RepID=A0A017T8N9_9BACT|nr:Hypothetical protein CAP_3259 [Chondromyces apiculatus DSM 436]